MDVFKLLYMYQIFLYILKLERLVKSRRALKNRRWWVKPHIRSHIRDALGGYQLVFVYFKVNDAEEFEKFMGVSIALFDELLNMVRVKLSKYGPRKPLTAEFKLATVLRYVHAISWHLFL